MENEYQKFADEIFKKLDRIVKYNNLQSVKENKSFKALWFRKNNLLWDVVRVQRIGNEIMCFDSNEHLKNIIFIANELPDAFNKEILKVFETSDIQVILIPMPFNLEKMIDKLQNDKIRVFIIFEYMDEVFEQNTWVQFPKVEKRN